MSSAITPYLVATDVTPHLVATESAVRALPWIDSWALAPTLDDACAYWRAPGSRFGGRDVGAASTGISGEKILTGRLSLQADGGDGVDVVETRAAADVLVANLPSGSAWIGDGIPSSQFLADGGYLAGGQMLKVPDSSWAWHPSCYVVDQSTGTFSFYPGILGNIVLRYRVRFASAFSLQFGTEQAVAAGVDSMSILDARLWSVAGASYWSMAGRYLGLASVRNFGGAEWILDAPDASALGVSAGEWIVLRLVATPPGQSPLPLFFLLSAPRST